MKIWKFLWLGVPVAIWFSYHPRMQLGQDDTMHYKLSITLIYLFLLAIVSLLVALPRIKLWRTPAILLVGAFTFYSILTVFWSPNRLRGILTAGITCMLFSIFLGVAVRQKDMKKILPQIIKIFLGSLIFMCLVAIFQLFAGALFSTAQILLCQGCLAQQFGFVRPNGFMIEPQFFGDLMTIAGLLISTIIINQRKKVDKQLWLILAMTFVVIILTLSRGALLSFIVGFFILCLIYHKKMSRLVVLMLVFIVSTFIALILQGTTAVINPSMNETFYGAVSRSVNQLSMGIIDISGKNSEQPKKESLSLDQNSPPTNQAIKTNDNGTERKPAFDGYVEESTNIRVNLTKMALSVWYRNAPTILFGVGLGGSGTAIYQAFSDEMGQRKIVQNEYVEILLERGLVGLILFVLILAGLFYATRKNKYVWAIIVACMTQWLFFSGYPSALYLYIALILIWLLATITPRHAEKELAKQC